LNSQQFTNQLQKVLDPDLTARPYNRFESHNTIWWLVPSTDWPAFKHGKFFINPIGSGKHEVGFDIEKGLGSKILQAFGNTESNRRQVMDETWLWRQIIDGSEPDFLRLEDKLGAISSIGEQVYLRVELSPHSPERGNPDNPVIVEHSSVTLEWEKDSFKLNKPTVNYSDEHARSFMDKISALGKCYVQDLWNLLKSEIDKEWAWANVLIYVKTDNINSSLISSLNEFKEWVR
jgi:hypothetical protein